MTTRNLPGPKPVRPPEDRLPPGQRLTDGWPVLTYGSTPRIDLATWEFRIFGLVEEEVRLSWDEFNALPPYEDTSDIHCVTTWSRYDNHWRGVRFSDVMALAKVLPEAKEVMFHSYGGYTTNVSLDELLLDGVLFAHTHDGQPIDRDHGGPLRGVIPQLYFWKSAKWCARHGVPARGAPGLLGDVRLPHPRRPVEGTALLLPVAAEGAPSGPLSWGRGRGMRGLAGAAPGSMSRCPRRLCPVDVGTSGRCAPLGPPTHPRILFLWGLRPTPPTVRRTRRDPRGRSRSFL